MTLAFSSFAIQSSWRRTSIAPGARKRWPNVVLPAAMPPTSNFTTCGSSVSGPKVATMECSGRTQVSAPGCADCAPQRMDFGQGKLRAMSGMMSASTAMASRPGFSTTAT